MKRKPKSVFVIGMAIMMISACNNARVPANLQQKLDSVKALEQLELLRAQGITVGQEVNPLQEFYDSLAIQPLPLQYSDNYIAELPNYQTVPQPLVQLMNFEGRVSTKAIALPETASLRLMLLAGNDGDNRVSLWLYTLGSDYYPVDKINLYRPVQNSIKADEMLSTEFSITSDYEVFLTTYKADHKKNSQRLFTVDELLHFKEWKTE